MRHIGNNHVHIIWNESYKEYQKMIPGDFGNCSIVIHPLDTFQYHIDILMDQDISLGPLQHSYVIPKQGLAELVRETALQAHRQCIQNQLSQGYLGSIQNFSTRVEHLKTLIERYSDAEFQLDQWVDLLEAET